MADLFEYLLWRGDLPFAQVPPNPVDTLICSELAYIDYSGLVPGDFRNPVPLHVVAEAFLALPDQESRVRVKKDIDLLASAAQTARFRNTKLVFYRSELLPEQESQFAAVTWLLDDGSALLSFRGTDMTMVGWKEDFNMSFQDCVPAQEKALHYTRAFAMVHPLPLRLCGHSKGGNMAVYAAAKLQPEVQSRILSVYNHDGPGFGESMMGDAGYLDMVPRIQTFVPQSSVIGMLLEHEEPYTVIKSRQISILQHEPYSWEVLGGDFIRVEEITEDSRFLDKTIKTWLADKTLAERNEFVDAVYELLSMGDVDDPREIILPWNVLRYIKTLGEDEEIRKLIIGEFTDLWRTAMQLKKAGEAAALPEKTR